MLCSAVHGKLNTVCASFVPHGVNRFDAHCTQRRRKSCQNTEQRKQKHCADSCPEAYLEVRIDYSVSSIAKLKHLKNHDSKEYSAHASHRSKNHTLGYYLTENVLRRGSYGAADAYLGSAFAHGYHHNVADSYRSGQQSADTNEQNKEVYTAEKIVEHTEKHLCIEHHDTFFVSRINLVSLCYDRAHLS